MSFNSNDENDNIVKFEATHSFTIFPRYPIILGSEGNENGIVKWNVSKPIKGKVDTWEGVTVKGNYNIEIDTSTKYTIVAKEVEDEKYGKQYDLIYITEILDLTNVKNQRSFLRTFLQEGQVDEFYRIYDNPLQIIDSEDIEALKKVKGVGDYIASRILTRYKENKDYAKIYIQLHDLGMTPNFIQKLIKRYSSPDKIIKIINENPYKLSLDIDGIGFITADNLALKNGMKKTSYKRIAGYIYYFFTSIANSGNSYVYAPNLTANIFAQFGGRDEIMEIYKDEEGNIIGNNISEAIEFLCEDGLLVVEENEDKAKRKVYLKKYYELEKAITGHLKRITEGSNNFVFSDWSEEMEKQEESQGWEFTDEQKEGIELTLENQVTFITGKAGCVDSETEYFNGTEWVKISNYQEGDKVLQFNEDRTAELIYPQKYHKYKTDIMYHLKTESGSIDQVLSDEHNVVYLTSKGNINKKQLSEVRTMHKKSTLGFHGRFMHSFNYIGGSGIDFSDDEIRTTLPIIFENSIYEFDAEWYDATKQQLEIIYLELYTSIWNNKEEGYNYFTTTSQINANYVQFVCTSLGYVSNIFTYNEAKDVKYEVRISSVENRTTSLTARQKSSKIEIKEYKNHNGYKYCFTVPSGMLVLRRNNRIFITGNSGKTSVLTGVLKALGASKGKYSFAQCALAGQAGARMQEITGHDGYTIHRLLGIDKETRGFSHNDKNPLPYDIIILDELSLVGGEIFLDLIKAIPVGSKLILLGDMGQLESIGALNLAKDIFDSPYVSTCELTKIHRQALKSGIIVASSSIRDGNQLFNASQTGEQVLGELKDMVFNLHEEKDGIKQCAFYYYKKYFVSDIVNKNIMDIQMLCPVKTRGDASVFNMNNLAQEFVNPKKPFINELVVPLPNDRSRSFTIRENDKVMNINNHYNLKNIDGDEKTVFNGWTGIVKSIKSNRKEAYIYFPMIDDIVIYTYKTLRKSIILGYASTVHKYQGSSNKIIIGVLDNATPPDMRTKELVYTLLTRAEKLCVMVCQSKALYGATNKSGITDKNTFLCDMLLDDDIKAIELNYDDYDIENEEL